MKLTNDRIKTLGPGLHRDVELPGFFIIVGAKKRTWWVQYDWVEELTRKRHTRRVRLGHWPQVSAMEARKQASVVLSARGKPKQEGPTLRQAWEDYRDLHLAPKVLLGKRSQRTVDNFSYFLPRLLGEWMDTPLDLLAQKRDVVRRKYVELCGRSLGSAKNAFGALRAIYRFAQQHYPPEQLTRPNPVSFQLDGPEPRQSGMAPDELAGWYARLQKVPCPIRKEFHLFTLLSGLRTTTVEEARWADLDVKRRALTIPAPKGGRHKKFDLPLSREMLRCLWRARKEGRILCPGGSEWIFVSAGSVSGHIQENKQAGLGKSKDGWSLVGHSLRHTWRSCTLPAGVSELSARLILNHARRDASESYITRDALWEFLLNEQAKISRFIMRHCRRAESCKEPQVVLLRPAPQHLGVGA